MKHTTIGSIVRVARDEKLHGRAIIATIDDDNDDTVMTIVWEDVRPKPLDGTTFLITPSVFATTTTEELEERTVLQSNVRQLLDFERQLHKHEDEKEENVAVVWKERGDQLLRLKDPSSAIPFYEKALSLTNTKLQVGCTVLIHPHSYHSSTTCLAPLLAEVDCLDATTGTADLTLVESGTEMVVETCSILLVLSESGTVQELQLRVLMNLARCLMLLSEYDTVYRASALLCISMAYTMTTTTTPSSDLPLSSFQPTCLLLRSKAYANLGKYETSMTDINDLLIMDGRNKQGRIWKRELTALMKQQELANKKLVKGMCQWISTATLAEPKGTMVSALSTKAVAKTETNHPHPTTRKQPWIVPLTTHVNACLFLLPAVIMLIAAVLYQVSRKDNDVASY